MENEKILIIEDEMSIADILSYKLQKEGYLVRCCASGKTGLKEMQTFKPHLVLLDLMLPDMSGFEVCKEITAAYKVPIIMLTARNDIVDKILGLELGADDYITKPFDIREVAARVKVVLRRLEASYSLNNDTVSLNNAIKVNSSARKVFKNEQEVRLKPKEFDVLLELYEHKNQVLTREQLLDKVWGYEFEGSLRTVDVHVQRLRKKLDTAEEDYLIETVFGVGYMLRYSK